MYEPRGNAEKNVASLTVITPARIGRRLGEIHRRDRRRARRIGAGRKDFEQIVADERRVIG